MRTICAALAAAGVMTFLPAGTAHADQEHCVGSGEFAHLPAGITRHQVERRWEVVGRAHWDAERSNPGYDAYLYPACGDHRADITVRIFYARHTRVWTLAIWNRRYP